VVNNKPAVAILGPGDTKTLPKLEEVAHDVGSFLAQAGYTVILRGDNKISISAAKGALESAGNVFVTMQAGAELSSELDDTGNLDFVFRPTMFQRAELVLEHADALIIFPGDLMALALLLQVWAYGSDPQAPYRPLVLVGEAWPGIVNSLAAAANLDRRTRAMVTFALTAEEAVESLRYYIAWTD
jgi:predicted Rossmann-fold nucleotide-binding protein